ncbi:hypothetical protein BASA81_003895 [Batrachochytrium salamandrivorans]|nr:hypothetical protein BASA81_003895 [Batrachochytrium salamandrivorans]
MFPTPTDNLPPPGDSAYDQLEKRIRALETEIPFFSSKAAELMVQRTDDNTYKLETERRLEELAILREQIKRTPSSAGNSLRNTPQTPHASLAPPAPLPQQHLPSVSSPLLVTPGASLLAVPQPAVVPATEPLAPAPLQRTSSMLSQPEQFATGLARSQSSQINQPLLSPQPQQPPPQQLQHVPPQQHALQQQLPPGVSGRDAAIAQAKKRAGFYSSPIEAVFLCSHHLDYNDLITMCCVSKTFKSKIKRSPGWRRIVIGLEATLRGHIGKITALTWFDTAIVTGGADGKIKFWDKNYSCFKTNNITPTPAHKFIHPKVKELQRITGGSGSSGHSALHPGNGSAEDEYPEFALAVTSLLTLDQKTILIGSEDGRLIVWITTEKRDFDCYVFTSSLTCMTLNHEQVFLGSADGRVALMSRRLNLSTPYAQLTPQFFHYGNKTHDSGVTALAFAGSYLFSGSASGRIYVWKVGILNHGEPALDYKGALVHRALRGDGEVSVEHTDRITALAGSSERLFSASWDCTIKQWNPLTLELLRDINVLPLGICWSLVIRRDQKPYSLVAGVRDNDLCVMDFETLEVLSSCNAYHWTSKLHQHTGWVKTLFAHPDGRIISGGSDDWSVKVWSARGRCIQTPQPYIFFGLPKGPINQEDLEILLSKSGSKYTAQHLQESKQEFDRACYTTENLSAEQKAEYQFQAVKQQEAWEKYRSEKRKKDEAAAAAAAAAAAPVERSEAAETVVVKVEADLPPPPPPPRSLVDTTATALLEETPTHNQDLSLDQQSQPQEETDRLLRQASIMSQQHQPSRSSSPTLPPTPPSNIAQTTGDDGLLSPDSANVEVEEEEDDDHAIKRMRTDEDNGEDNDSAAALPEEEE